MFVPIRSRHFRFTPRDKGVMSTCRWQDDRVAAIATMVTAMPDHRRCGTARRLAASRDSVIRALFPEVGSRSAEL